MIDRQRLIGALVVVLTLLAAFSLNALAPQNQPGPTDPGDGGCYCGVALCSCASPPAGYTLEASCTCGSSCTRSCTYKSK
jgi:hypothetical protein